MEHRVSFKVYYEDTDSLGVVYYANYFKYLERGRAEFLESFGRSVADWNRDGYLFVVHSVEATFRRPAALGETIDVVTALELPSRHRARFRQRIEKDGQLVLRGRVDVACLDPRQRLIPFPDELRAAAGLD
jgi:acyl-CoA thioester hydrolase